MHLSAVDGRFAVPFSHGHLLFHVAGDADGAPRPDPAHNKLRLSFEESAVGAVIVYAAPCVQHEFPMHSRAFWFWAFFLVGYTQKTSCDDDVAAKKIHKIKHAVWFVRPTARAIYTQLFLSHSRAWHDGARFYALEYKCSIARDSNGVDQFTACYSPQGYRAG